MHNPYTVDEFDQSNYTGFVTVDELANQNIDIAELEDWLNENVNSQWFISSISYDNVPGHNIIYCIHDDYHAEFILQFTTLHSTEDYSWNLYNPPISSSLSSWHLHKK